MATKKKSVGITDRLENVIGQTNAKRKLNFLLAGMSNTGMMPHMFMSGEAGGGKSFLAKQVAIATANIQQERMGERRKFVQVNGTQFQRTKDFEDFVLETLDENLLTVLVDECHAIGKSVETKMLSMLEPSNSNKGFFAVGAGETERRVEIDFQKVTFIFATTDKEKMAAPLMRRLEEINLEPLRPSELAMVILTQCNKDAEITDKALVELVSRLRMNGGSAIKMGEHVNAYLSAFGADKFDVSDAKELFKIMRILPMGITDEELRVMNFLRAHPQGVRLQDIANQLNQSAQTIKSIEAYLLRRGLMVVDGKRFISNAGKDYLNEIEDENA